MYRGDATYRFANTASSAASGRDADKRADELTSRAHETSEEVEGNWNQLKSDWDQHVRRLRERLADQKTSIDTIVAARDAESAEADALDAIDFAASAIEEAEYAVLNAKLATMKAESLAAS